MTRKLYRVIDGEVVELGGGEINANQSAIIIGDAIEGLKHPVTGKVFDSLSAYMKENKRLGLEVVGNDLLSKKKRMMQDKITESVIMDRTERAEAILSDPSKRREFYNRNERALETRERLLRQNGHRC